MMFTSNRRQVYILRMHCLSSHKLTTSRMGTSSKIASSAKHNSNKLDSATSRLLKQCLEMFPSLKEHRVEQADNRHFANCSTSHRSSIQLPRRVHK